MKLINIKKFSIVLAIATLFCVMSFTTAFAEDVVTEPVTEPVATEPVYTEPKTEPETEPATEPVTEPETEPETEPVTEPETEPATEPETEPETEPVTENYTEPTYDVNKLPTLVDSTQVAEELPTAIGADEDGGVSFVGGVVCWIAVIISACVIIAFLLSTKVKGKNMGKFKRYQ
nr:hypothetical protein [uncultured Ruminococcus sp.]